MLVLLRDGIFGNRPHLRELLHSLEENSRPTSSAAGSSGPSRPLFGNHGSQFAAPRSRRQETDGRPAVSAPLGPYCKSRRCVIAVKFASRWDLDGGSHSASSSSGIGYVNAAAMVP